MLETSIAQNVRNPKITEFLLQPNLAKVHPLALVTKKATRMSMGVKNF